MNGRGLSIDLRKTEPRQRSGQTGPRLAQQSVGSAAANRLVRWENETKIHCSPKWLAGASKLKASEPGECQISENHLINSQRARLKIELQKASRVDVTLGIAAWMLSESVHASKQDGCRIGDSSVTPQYITVDQQQWLIMSAFNKIALDNAALLL